MHNSEYLIVAYSNGEKVCWNLDKLNVAFNFIAIKDTKAQSAHDSKINWKGLKNLLYNSSLHVFLFAYEDHVSFWSGFNGIEFLRFKFVCNKMPIRIKCVTRFFSSLKNSCSYLILSNENLIYYFNV